MYDDLVAHGSKHTDVTAQASQETKQGLLTGVWGPRRVSVLLSLKMVKCAFNEWLLAGAGGFVSGHKADAAEDAGTQKDTAEGTGEYLSPPLCPPWLASLPGVLCCLTMLPLPR